MLHVTPEDPASHAPLWRLTGARSGPTLVVACAPSVLDEIVRELSVMPGLVYLRGALWVGADGVEPVGDYFMRVDDGDTAICRDQILARIRHLGMLSGRGVVGRERS